MARRGDLNVWWRFGIRVVGPVARLVFRIRVEGGERVPGSGSAIVAANHLSALDGVVLALVVGRQARMTRFLTAAEFFRKPALAWALRVYRQIPLRRGEGDAGALDEAIRAARAGAVVGIFPEGQVNPAPSDGLQRGRTGAARIALASGARILPMGIWGTQLRYPKEGLHLRRPWRTPLAIVFGEPVVAAGDPSSPEDIRQLTAVLMERIGGAVDRARRLARA